MKQDITLLTAQDLKSIEEALAALEGAAETLGGDIYEAMTTDLSTIKEALTNTARKDVMSLKAEEVRELSNILNVPIERLIATK